MGADDPLLDRLVGHFRVVALLGRGGMGAVYRADDARLDRQVALKVLPLDRTDDAERRARMLREARAGAAVTHPNVATVYEVGETEGGLLWIAMELVEGESLRALMARQGALPLDEALRIARDIARAVGRAHARGIVHRDLKPENVMLDAEGRVKVLDFGIASLTTAGAPADLSLATTVVGAHASRATEALTRKGAVLGTPEYMAPEQARGGAVGPHTDVWAIGVILHEMLAGERPFRGTTEIELVAAVLESDPLPLLAAPPAVAALVQRCLAREPAARPPDGRALGDALDALGAPGAASLVSTPTPTNRVVLTPAPAALTPRPDASADTLATPLAIMTVDETPPHDAARPRGATAGAVPQPETATPLAPRRARGFVTPVRVALGVAALGVAALGVARVARRGRAVTPPPRATAAAAAPRDAGAAPALGASPREVPEIVPRRLTYFGAATIIRDLAVAPDGRTFVVVLPDRLERRRVEGGEPAAIAVPDAREFGAARFSARGDTLFVGRAAPQGDVVELASDGRVVRTLSGAVSAWPSPDGGRVALIDQHEGLAIDERGARTALLGQQLNVGSLAWSRDQRALAFVHASLVGLETSLSVVHVEDQRIETVLETTALLQAGATSPVVFDGDDCLLFFLAERPAGAVLQRACRAAGGWGAPQPVARIRGSRVMQFALGPAATHSALALLGNSQVDLWTAPVRADGALGELVPWVHTDADERDPRYARDGGLLFHSNRTGRWAIYRRARDGTVERVIEVPEHATYPEPDADGGAWFFLVPRERGRAVLARRARDGAITRVREVGAIEHASLVGRPPPRSALLACARAVPGRCLVGETEAGAIALSWVEHPERTVRLPANRPTHIELSPDGRRLAVFGVEGLQLVDAADLLSTRRVASSVNLRYGAFTPDGRTLYVTGANPSGRFAIGAVDVRTGAFREVGTVRDATVTGATVSPDGREITLARGTRDNDVYALDLPPMP